MLMVLVLFDFYLCRGVRCVGYWMGLLGVVIMKKLWLFMFSLVGEVVLNFGELYSIVLLISELVLFFNVIFDSNDL